MQILGLVFALLLIIGYGFHASWEKQAHSFRLRSTYLGHEQAQRKILCKYQAALYKNLRSPSNETPTPRETNLAPKKTKSPDLNGHCAKLNLWPLIQEGKEAHPFLYETAAKLLRTFYNKQLKAKKGEYHLLDAILAAAEKEKSPILEKLPLKERVLYYKILKGTKEWDIAHQKGYPPLLDYFKIEANPEKLCLSHAHPDLLAILFNPKAAEKIYRELHKVDSPPITPEFLTQTCNEAHLIHLDPSLFQLIEFGHTSHEQLRKTFVAKDSQAQVSLRQNLPLKNFL